MPKITKKKFTWGELVTIEEGHSFKCILHPEIIELIKKNPSGTFLDEQGVRWAYMRNASGLLHLEADQGREFEVELSDVLTQSDEQRFNEAIDNAIDRLQKAKRYGADMITSKNTCMSDAANYLLHVLGGSK